MAILTRVSSCLLREMFDESNAIFSYSSFRNGDKLINNFTHASVIRYTLNALLGIQKYVDNETPEWNFNKLLEMFVSLNIRKVDNDGDKGILLYLLTKADHDLKSIQFKVLKKIVDSEKRLLSLNLQEVCWILIGLIKYAEKYSSEESLRVTEKLFRILNNHFVNKNTLLPYHSLKRYRKTFVSFGAIVYFMWAVYEYWGIFKDENTKKTFKETCARIINLQGENGEWPWFIDNNNLTIMDWYPIYSVHQDSMAMLFLLPALKLNIEGVNKSIEKSYQWLFGSNELKVSMINKTPFFIYRSLHRKELFEKERRFLRALILNRLNKNSRKAKTTEIEINRECRSYHLGWILYVWSGINDFPEFTNLAL